MSVHNVAHFDLVKLQNQKTIRNLLRMESPQTIAQLAEKSSLSYPTVATLLKELEKGREVCQSLGLESRGGRPGIQYELDVTYQCGLILYLEKQSMTGKVYNVYGHPIQTYSKKVPKEMEFEVVVDFVQRIQKEFDQLSVISIGIPGVVKERTIVSLPAFKRLEGTKLYEKLVEVSKAKVFIENDINAIALAEAKENDNFAHIAYVDNCIGAGIVLNGELYTGNKGYAGVLEYLCQNIEDRETCLVQCILSLVCVLNLPLIYLSDTQCDDVYIDGVINRLQKILPRDRIPIIRLLKNLNIKYQEGLYNKILQYWENSI